MKIVTDEKVLRQRSIEVEKPNWKFVAKLAATLLATPNGVGLSAIQVGIPARIFVLAWPKGSYSTFIDPIIVKAEGECESTEGCLSLPGVIRKIKRAQYVELVYTNDSEIRIKQSFDGLLAIAIQHECDHLDGILLTDHPEIT